MRNGKVYRLVNNYINEWKRKTHIFFHQDVIWMRVCSSWYFFQRETTFVEKKEKEKTKKDRFVTVSKL